MGESLIEETLKQSIFEIPDMLLSSFNKLYEFMQQEILCDVVIQVGKKSFKCHRNILCSCSLYFQAMFTSQLSESKQQIITINDIDEIAMEALINFAYTAKVELNSSNAQSILHASSVLQFDSLAQVCCKFIKLQLHPSNCLGILQLAHQLGQSDLVHKSQLYAKFHFSQVVQENEFISITDKHLDELISSQDVLVESEIEVYEAVMLWIKHDVRSREGLLPKLLSKVHLPLLPLTYLRMYVESDILIRKNMDCRDLLDEAIHFQIWQLGRMQTSHLLVNQRTRPRKSYSGLIFCIGGRGSNGNPFSSVEFYTAVLNKWLKLRDMTTSRRHVGCVSVEGKVYAVGGCDENGHLSSAEVLDPAINKWSLLASMSIPRRGLGLCALYAVGKCIYAVGGLDDEVFFNTVERYDINADLWKTVSPMNTPRGGVAVVKLKGLMYALGGNSGPVSVKTCEVYDPHIDKWTFISSMNCCRAGASAAVVDGFIYIIGGFDNNLPLNTVEKYDPDNDTWSYASPMMYCRGGVGAAALGGYIYAVGGHTGFHYLKTVEVYDVQRDRWEMGPDICECRAGAGVTWCAGKTNIAVLKEHIETNVGT